MKALKVGIAGLGRIGRGVLRANYAKIAQGRFDVCVICDVMPIDQVAYLLAHDSTYGRPPFTLDFQGNDLLIGDKRVRYERVDRRRRPDEDTFGALREFDLDVFIDATGTANIQHLRAIIDQKVAKKVVCTNNVAGIDLSIVYGVNTDAYDPKKHDVVSSSTCTGNGFAPIAYILNKHFGLEYARAVTIHPALSDQRALDSYHATSHLGRSCAASIIPTSTNVGASTALVLPELEGKMDSLSYRVPTEIVSVIDLSATLGRDTSRDECIDLFEKYARNELKGVLHCDYGMWGHQRASIDYLGTEFSSILVMKHLNVSHKRMLSLSIMHDNEAAYCCRVLDVLSVIQKAKKTTAAPRLPKEENQVHENKVVVPMFAEKVGKRTMVEASAST